MSEGVPPGVEEGGEASAPSQGPSPSPPDPILQPQFMDQSRPPEEGFHRQHPVAAVANSLSLIRSNLLTIVVLVFLGGNRENRTSLYMLGASFALVLVVGIGRWVRFRYRALPGRLVVLDGLVVRRKLTLPRERIQVMEVVEGFVERLFGLVSLRIQTGSQRESVMLRALSRAEADRVMDTIRSAGGSGADDLARWEDGDETGGEHGQGQSGMRESGESAAEPSTTRPIDRFTPQLEASIGRRRLVVAAATSGGVGVALSILGTLYTQIEAVMGGSALVDWLAERLPGLGLSTWTVLFALFLALSWLLSFSGFLLSNAGFVIRADHREAVVSRGLLERRRTTLPFGRIQALRYVQGLLRQPFGMGSLQAESIGVKDGADGGSTLVFPLLARRDLAGWPARMFEAMRFAPVGRTLPRRALRRYLLRACLPVLLAGSMAFGVRFDGVLHRIPDERVILLPHLAEPFGAMRDPEVARAVWRWLAGIGFAALAAGGLGWSRWRATGLVRVAAEKMAVEQMAERLVAADTVVGGASGERPAAEGQIGQERLVMRRRVLALETVVVPANRIQDMTLSQSLFQRRSSLATLTVRYASGVTGRAVSLRDLQLEDAAAQLAWFRERQGRAPRGARFAPS